jgi:enamine deaminase RidA (YjgF/YER057c/UK114 family)
MEKRFLTKQAPHAWPFSHGVVVSRPGRVITLAGQVGYDRHGPDRKLVGPGDVGAQARQAFENIKTLLAKEGASLKDVIDFTVYLTDVNDLLAVGRVAQEYISDPPPVMTLIGVKALAFPDLLVEIRAVAVTAA